MALQHKSMEHLKAKGGESKILTKTQVSFPLFPTDVELPHHVHAPSTHA